MIGRIALVSVLVLAGCASDQGGDDPDGPILCPVRIPAETPGEPGAPERTPRAEAPPDGWVEISEFVRVNRARRVVEVDGFVPIDCHDPGTPIVYLEVIACAVDSKEHESLVATRAKASHVHAALLLAGLEPGHPGSWSWDEKTLTRHAPEGPGVDVFLVPHNAVQTEVGVLATDWVVNAETGESLTGHLRALGDGSPWVFAGSRMVEFEGREFYDADGAGIIVGLHTFGGEVVALREVMSHDSGVSEPEWIADAGLVPAYGTPVTVRMAPGE